MATLSNTCFFEGCISKAVTSAIKDREDLRIYCRVHQRMVSGISCTAEGCDNVITYKEGQLCGSHYKHGPDWKPQRSKGMKIFLHGSASTYSNHKCRCQECVDAWNKACRESKRSRVGLEDVGAREHGKESTYQYGCRCSACKSGHNEYRKEAYAIQKLRALMPEQSKCDCCGKYSKKKLVTDHIHGTTTIRGLLCHSCNTGIGKLGDNIEGVLMAVAYLQKTL